MHDSNEAVKDVSNALQLSGDDNADIAPIMMNTITSSCYSVCSYFGGVFQGGVDDAPLTQARLGDARQA